jgi:hypothetical protein
MPAASLSVFYVSASSAFSVGRFFLFARWQGLTHAGVHVLSNRGQELPDFCVVGMDSYWGGNPRIKDTFQNIPADKPILLA